jgi:16S rRNA (cytosine1402-N4)-methyltransferase
MMNYHQPVLLNESIEGLKIKSGGIYVDATFGGGGHSRKILERLGKGRLFAFDQDADAMVNIPDDKRVTFVHHNFRFLTNFLRYYDINGVDGILADLGVSSHQFDNDLRGFSYRFKGALDMRMNKNADNTAANVINLYSREELVRIFRDYGELKNPHRLADNIIKHRQQKEILTIDDLLKALEKNTPAKKGFAFLSKVFQALRIEVNREIDFLREFLLQTSKWLNPAGRLVIISYHSLEDRLVKNYIRSGNFENIIHKDIYGNYKTPLKAINRKVIVPGEEEIKLNPRARSAKMRIAEKL